MKKTLKQLGISLFSAIFTMFVVYGGYSLYAADIPVISSTDSFLSRTFNDLALANVSNQYHGEMNDYFNLKMERLNELIDDMDFEHEDFLPPSQVAVPNLNPVEDELPEIVEKCGEDNVSTYCVSMGALDLYLRYVNALNRLKGTLVEGTGDSVSDLYQATQNRYVVINREIEEARRVLETTVATYNEYRLAYPMHKKYQEIADNLVLYRSALNEINRELINWPVEFVDATTHKCP